jgi:hypothetical protein
MAVQSERSSPSCSEVPLGSKLAKRECATAVLAALVVSGLLCCGMGGCGSSPGGSGSGSSGGIAGKYVLETDPTNEYLMLRADGSYEMKYKGIGSTDVSTYTGKWRRDGEQLLLLCGLLNGYDFCDPDSPPTKTGTLKGGRYVAKIWPELLGPEVWVKQ